jgi:hypothetical protein
MPSWAKAAARLTTLGTLVGCLVCLCAAERYTFRYYTQTDGLRDLSVNCLVRDRTGFLWVGTESGLFRYDGFRFRPIGTPEINVHSLREDQAGRIWIGAIDGLYYLDGSRWDEVLTDRAGMRCDRVLSISKWGPPLPSNSLLTGNWLSSAGMNSWLSVRRIVDSTGMSGHILRPGAGRASIQSPLC